MKRFWTSANVVEVEAGWTVHLDTHPVRTPARSQIVVPMLAVAEEIAAEWNAQKGEVAPLSMPTTRAAATCVDRVAPEHDAVVATVAAYGETDLLCYRADTPQALADRQAHGWDPVLAWAREDLKAPLEIGTGVMHIAQPAEAIEALARAVAALDPWRLTCLAELTTISGSLILGLAVQSGSLDPFNAWALSRIDENWNIEQWGEDHEASLQAARREGDFLHAARLLKVLDNG